MKAIKTEYRQALIRKGYCRISNRHGIVSRIDRSDWKEYMAKKHSPWSIEAGMEWVSFLGTNAEDHYRRCYSKDTIELGSGNRAAIFPASSSTKTGYKDKGV